MSINPGDDPSPHYKECLLAVRLANAWSAATEPFLMRFIVACNTDNGIDDDLPMVILDARTGMYITLGDLLDWLPENLRMQVLWS